MMELGRGFLASIRECLAVRSVSVSNHHLSSICGMIFAFTALAKMVYLHDSYLSLHFPPSLLFHIGMNARSMLLKIFSRVVKSEPHV